MAEKDSHKTPDPQLFFSSQLHLHLVLPPRVPTSAANEMKLVTLLNKAYSGARDAVRLVPRGPGATDVSGVSLNASWCPEDSQG